MDSISAIEEICTAAERVRMQVPLVHNITNYVTVNDVANAELAIGGSALMADDIREVDQMVDIASATNINIGTLNERTIESMLQAGRHANQTGTVVIFDPVGAGASTLRNDTTRAFLDQVRPTVIRGNLSEISFVAGLDVSTKGVDSAEADADNDAVVIARSVAQTYRCVVAITGAVDVITDGKETIKISNGVPQMGKVTGTGCMCDGLLGAFVGAVENASVSHDVLIATAGAIVSMGIAGQESAKTAKGTGSLRTGIIDTLSNLDADTYRWSARIEVL